MESSPWADGGALPALSPATAAAPADPAARLCLRWLRLACRQEIQQHRWSRLEHVLVEEHGWLGLAEAERRAGPQGRALRRIEDRIDRLYAEGEAVAQALGATRSASLRGVYAKLAVVERMIWPDDDGGAARPLLAAAIDEFAALCPEVRDQPLYRLSGRYRPRAAPPS